jgi:hypothetical protein
MAMLLDENTALNLVLTLLQQKQVITEPDVVEAVEQICKMAPGVDSAKLKSLVDASVNVHVGSMGVLEDSTDHVVWLPERRGAIKWRFWDRYEWYLRHRVEGMAPKAVDAVDEVTTSVLERLEDPERPGEWDRRGMVMGDVQAGKTSNYVGLICKAADAGYRFIVVLAGLHNNLRSQTQLRVDLGFLGFDTEKNLTFNYNNKRVGVGALPQKEFGDAVAHALTSSKPDGDFNTVVAGNAAVNPKGNDPIILVVKKNKSVLLNLISYLQGYSDHGTHKLDVPALVIDDEADNASVNTKKRPGESDEWKDDEVTAINGCIRQLLMLFRKRAYVGYTATPYANIFIHSEDKAPGLGADLFPSAFVLTLPTPSDHVGPVEVFGLREDRQLGTAAREGLPIVRIIEDDEADAFMPPKHKMTHVPTELPASLEEALRCFVLSCALRCARGQEKKHESMLIHVTRFVAVQKAVHELVKNRLGVLASAMKTEGKTRDAEMDVLKGIWEKDYVPTTDGVMARWEDPRVKPVAWSEIAKRIPEVVPKIEIETINGEAADIQRYKAAEEAGHGCYLIAVGGDKLSRGLTLEGLTVSYFLRASKMYDTLMQMGRWFGYRPGYLDACRLYTTQELRDWYQHLALVNLELRQDFDYMTMKGARPIDFGLRVRQHPGGMVITSANKIRPGKKLKVSFADSLAETTAFFLDKAPNQANQKAASELIEKLGSPQKTTESGPETGEAGESVQEPYFRWDGVKPEIIVEFLRGYQNHPKSMRSRPDLLADFIELQVEKAKELTSWTVAVIRRKSADKKSGETAEPPSYDFGSGVKGRCTERKDANGLEKKSPYTLSKQHLISPDHELIDLDDDELKVALEKTTEAWAQSSKKNKSETAPKRPSGKGARAARPEDRGLLLLYQIVPKSPDRREDTSLPVTAFAISFPASENAQSVQYKVNNVYWEEEFGGGE